jgi:hypothetical protein
VPTIAVVDGVRIVLWPNDHAPPHIHALFGDEEARISIETGECLSGSLPKAKMRAVLAWLGDHRDEAAFAWSELRAGRSPHGRP